MKKIILITCLLFLEHSFMLAQNKLCGKVISNEKGKEIPIAFATIKLLNENQAHSTNSNGEFCFDELKGKSYTLEISCLGYNKKLVTLEMPTTQAISIELTQGTFQANEVIISSTRASEKNAATYQIIGKKELDQLNIGQDLPYIFQYTPSVVSTSDAGAGVGYTSLRIRGTDGTRINTTVNGIPVNDAESQGTFFVNFPDLISSAQSVQIQRGVGTSSNGSAAFGASINIQTLAMRDSSYAETNNTIGSFNTYKNTILFGTGLLNNCFTINGRLSRIISDGFIDRGSSNMKSLYLDASYFGKKTSIHYVNFSGIEKTFQAWNGIPQAKYNAVNNNVTDTNLINHYYNNLGYLYVTKQDSINLFNSNNNTYNYFTYPNQTDNYSQYNHQLHLTHNFNNNLLFNVTAHYTKGAGYYEEYKINNSLSDYGIDPVIVNNDTITNTTLIRQKWLDNNFYGLTYALNYKTGKWQTKLGGASNQYDGKHFTKIIWSEFAGTSNNQEKYNYTSSIKNDHAVYLKNSYSIDENFTIYSDLQFRKISYNFEGFNIIQQAARQIANYNFFNPKVGVNKVINRNSSIYASLSIANREPTREDFIASTPVSRPTSEQLRDLEVGYKYAKPNWMLELVAYHMNYKNQLVLTGKINDVGAYTRTNTPKSARTGIEIVSEYKLNNVLKFFGNITLSMNKIDSFDEFVYEYFSYTDSIAVHKTTYTNTDIAFSPNIISSIGLQYNFFKNFCFIYNHKYVGSQFLDNTENENKKLKAFNTADVKLIYTVNTKLFKKLSVMLAINNLLNAKYVSNGYTYSSRFEGKLINENFVYPQAGINFLLGVNIAF